MFRYICSVFLCLGMFVRSSPAWAKTSHRPTSIHLGMDIFRPFQYKYYGQKGTQYEFNISTDFSNILLEGDYGWGSIYWKGCNQKTNIRSSYTSGGKYFRVGLNYNFLPDTPSKNKAFLGILCAASFFQDRLVSQVAYDSTGQIKDVEVFSIDTNQLAVRAHWFEVVAGVKVKVWKLLYVGSTICYKFGLHFNGADSHVPYDVLGWGLNNGEESFGFNLYLSLRIPFVRDTMPSSKTID
jgi:hypothetical protein